MSKGTVTLPSTYDALTVFQQSVRSRQALEDEVATMGHALRVLESDLRKAVEAERKAVRALQEAAELRP